MNASRKRWLPLALILLLGILAVVRTQKHHNASAPASPILVTAPK